MSPMSEWVFTMGEKGVMTANLTPAKTNPILAARDKNRAANAGQSPDFLASIAALLGKYPLRKRTVGVAQVGSLRS